MNTAGTNIVITTADISDFEELRALDRHISDAELKNVISLKRIYAARIGENIAGWLRYGLFWDNTPFMNMLYIIESHRNHGIGGALVGYWETEMVKSGYDRVMTSTASDEYAQHFYIKLGYKAVGGFIPTGSPFEVLFEKIF